MQILHRLTRKYRDEKKDVRFKFSWGPLEQRAFEDLVASLCCAPVYLAHPNPNKPYDLFIDASDYGLGAALFQDGHLVDAVSKQLKPYQQSYEIREKELGSLITALDKMDVYLDGAQVTVYCDHKSLSNLARLKLSARLTRWLVKLMRYDFKVMYIEGENNHVADALSRMMDRLQGPKEALTDEIDGKQVMLIMNEMLAKSLDHKNVMVVGQDRVTENWVLADRIQNELKLPAGFHTFEQQQNVLLVEKSEAVKGMAQNWGPLSNVVKMVENEDEKMYWMRLAHNMLHYRVESTCRIVQKYVTWRGMQRDVAQFVATCANCNLHHPWNHFITHDDGGPPVPTVAGSAFDIIQVDVKEFEEVLDPAAFTIKKVLTIICCYTGWVVVVPIYTEDAVEVAVMFMERFGYVYGMPNALQ